MAIYTVEWTKVDATFADATEANADRYAGVSQDLKDRVAAVNSTLLSSGVLNSPETYSWNQSTGVFTITRDVSDLNAFTTEYNTIADELVSAFNANLWVRTKKMA